MQNWEVLGSEKVLDTKWLVVEKQKCKINDKDIIDDYYIIKRKDFVIIIAEENENILFLEQYRHGIRQSITNLPMGLIDENETPKETAIRELLEETGYKTDDLEDLGEFYLAPSNTSAKAHVFYTKKIIKGNIEKTDEKEGELVLMSIPKKHLKEKIKNNEIKDMATITALHIAKNKLDLF